eukprot:2239383-Prorocentrum_lima.AAC.1
MGQASHVHPRGSYHHHRHDAWLEISWAAFLREHGSMAQQYPTWWSVAQWQTVWSTSEDYLVDYLTSWLLSLV